jgi:predicted phosphate transport protein (TIGR00153 family)
VFLDVSADPESAVAIRLRPQSDGFYDLCGRVAAYHVAAADELTGLLAGGDDTERRAVAKRIGEIEKSADEVTHEIVRRITTTFVTPLDRDDLHRLATALDDCVDHMEDAADLVKIHAIDSFTPRHARLVDVIVRLAHLTLEAMPRLRTLSDLSDYWIEVNRLENQATKNHRRLVAELLTAHAADPIRALREVLLADALHGVVSAYERVAHTIEGIAVKET